MNAKTTLLGCFVLMVTLCLPCFAQTTIPLDQAIKDGNVSVEITGMGGSTGDTIQITVQRKVPETLRLSLRPGTVFKSISGKVQNMLAVSIIAVARQLLQDVEKAEEIEKQPQQKPGVAKEPEVKVGDTVVVSEDGTKLRVGSKVLAELKKGTTLEVAKVKGNWIGGYVALEGKKQTGWVKKSEVRLPGTNDKKAREIWDWILVGQRHFG